MSLLIQSVFKISHLHRKTWNALKSYTSPTEESRKWFFQIWQRPYLWSTAIKCGDDEIEILNAVNSNYAQMKKEYIESTGLDESYIYSVNCNV